MELNRRNAIAACAVGATAAALALPSAALAEHPDREILTLFARWRELLDSASPLQAEVDRIGALYPNVPDEPVADELLGVVPISSIRTVLEKFKSRNPAMTHLDGWFAECEAIDEREELAEVKAELRAAQDEAGFLEDRIILETTAQTPAGVAAKLHVVFDHIAASDLDTSTDPKDWDWPERVLWVAIGDVERLAEGGAA